MPGRRARRSSEVTFCTGNLQGFDQSGGGRKIVFCSFNRRISCASIYIIGETERKYNKFPEKIMVLTCSAGNRAIGGQADSADLEVRQGLGSPPERFGLSCGQVGSGSAGPHECLAGWPPVPVPVSVICVSQPPQGYGDRVCEICGQDSGGRLLRYGLPHGQVRPVLRTGCLLLGRPT